MLKQKKISLKLVKQGSSHIRVPAENFDQLNSFSSHKLDKILIKIEEAYPNLPIMIDMRKADLSIVGNILRLKKIRQENFNYTLLMNESSPHRFTLESLNALTMFNVVFAEKE